MIRCGNCSRDNPDGSTRCMACGAALSAMRNQPTPAASRAPTFSCTSCGTAIPPGFKFCGACGTPVVVKAATSAPAQAAIEPNTTAQMMAPTSKKTVIRAKVVLLGSDGTILSVFPLLQEDSSVGTAGDVRLSDPFAAPVQGRFVFRGTKLSYVPHPQTMNGMFMLLKREHLLWPGAHVRVGRQLIVVEMNVSLDADPTLWGSPNPKSKFAVRQIFGGGGEGDFFPLKEGDNLIGRAAGDISFPADGYVSSRHATLSIMGDQMTLKDLGSSNGTFIRIESDVNVEPGDLMVVGEQLLRVDPP